MAKDTNDYLFEYIKKALYEKQFTELDIDQLPEEYQKLGAGIAQMCLWVHETKHFSEEIAKGNLDVKPPNVENVIASNLKALQSTLNHLTWQAEQIAKGDYNQKVEFMGMFSTAFNRMTEQLRDRTEALAREMHYVSEQNESMRRNNEMFQIFTQKSHEYIIVLAAENHDILYCNDSMKSLLENISDTEGEQFLGEAGMFRQCPCSPLKVNVQWQYKSPQRRYYSVQSIYIQWKEQAAYAHSFTDVTLEKEREELIENLAFKDSLTGNYNRRYGMELLDRMQKENRRFALGFVDVDFLKYCNDELGHEQGDQYIRNISETLIDMPVEKTVCRVGGDEFMVILENVNTIKAEKYLSQARSKIMEQNIGQGAKLPQCFSYGVVDNYDCEYTDISDMLSRADRKMYRYKIAAKEKMRKKFSDELICFVDDRVN